VIPLSYFLVLSIILFCLGILLFFVKRDFITMFMAVEVMLTANLAFLTFAKGRSDLGGQMVVFFVITVAAAEAAVGLAIILLVFRRNKSIRTEDLRSMRG